MLKDIAKRLADESGKSMRQIACEMQVSEKTLTRLLSGEAGSPSLYTLVSFLRVCCADLDDVLDIFAELQFFLTAEINQKNAELQDELRRARGEIDNLLARITDLTAEREALREKNDRLRDELLDLYRTGKG